MSTMVLLVLRASEDAEEAEGGNEVNLGANKNGENNGRGQWCYSSKSLFIVE